MGPESEQADGRINMAKEPEVPGQEDIRYGASFELAHRQLSCGCWVAMEHTGACAVHGKMPPQKKAYGLLRTMTCEEFEALGFQPTWLDEVAARMAQGLLAHEECFSERTKFQEIAIDAYNLAQALLAEGKKRREADLPASEHETGSKTG